MTFEHLCLDENYFALTEVKNICEEKKYELFFCTTRGSQNQNLDTPHSDIDTVVFIIPSMEDTMLNKKMVSEEVVTSNGICLIRDFRLGFKEFQKCNFNSLSYLYTTYFIVNAYFKVYYDKLVSNREWIALSNKFSLYKQTMGEFTKRSLKIMSGISKYTEKDLSKLCYIYYFLTDLNNGLPFEQCLYTSHRNKVLDVKCNSSSPDKSIEDMYEELKSLELKFKNYFVSDVSTFFDNLTINILMKGWNIQ